MNAASDPRPVLAGLTLAETGDLLAGLSEPRWRAAQVFGFVWREGITDPAEMTVLSKALRARLAEAAVPESTTVVETQRSRDGTEKILVGLADGTRVETVIIPDDGRRTVCVSTQVGCPIACVFCASGVGGLVRNLTTAEIAEQVLHARRRLGERPSHVVVMGMGEPLMNLQALGPAISIWTDAAGMDIGARRVTVSTAGTPGMIDRLASLDLGVHLAVSLHGPDDATRARLVPTNPDGRVADLVDAAARFARNTGRDVTVEYVLIAGENDASEHADALAKAVAGRHIHVNLIPLNPVAHRKDLTAPSGIAARAFARRLEAGGVPARLRTRHGDDIAAACGQLAMERSAAKPRLPGLAEDSVSGSA